MSILTVSNQVFEAKDLNLWYGDNHALKNIDFPINKKEVTAMIGPSKSRKIHLYKDVELND